MIIFYFNINLNYDFITFYYLFVIKKLLFIQISKLWINLTEYFYDLIVFW